MGYGKQGDSGYLFLHVIFLLFVSTSRHPNVKWAQRPDMLFITIELPGAKDVKLKLEPEGKFHFSASSGADNSLYEVNMDLLDKVDVNDIKTTVGLRSNICYLIKKAESKWWCRLLKQGGKLPSFLKVDWDKWVDEDEEDDAVEDSDFGEIDFSKLNMDGGEDAEFDDDYDEDLDDSDEEEDNEDEISIKKLERCLM